MHGQAVKSDLEGRTFDHDPKYLNMRIGMNSRLDTIQAAILLEKLAVFGAFSLYLNFINIFQLLLNFTGQREE